MSEPLFSEVSRRVASCGFFVSMALCLSTLFGESEAFADSSTRDQLFSGCVESGNPDFDRNLRVKAAEKCVDAVRSGDARAYSYLGLLYATGDLLPKDERAAVRYWNEGARAGDRASIRMMAILYEKGQWVVKDEGKALTLYRIAAEMGDSLSIEKLRKKE